MESRARFNSQKAENIIARDSSKYLLPSFGKRNVLRFFRCDCSLAVCNCGRSQPVRLDLENPVGGEVFETFWKNVEGIRFEEMGGWIFILSFG